MGPKPAIEQKTAAVEDGMPVEHCEKLSFFGFNLRKLSI